MTGQNTFTGLKTPIKGVAKRAGKNLEVKRRVRVAMCVVVATVSMKMYTTLRTPSPWRWIKGDFREDAGGQKIAVR